MLAITPFHTFLCLCIVIYLIHIPRDNIKNLTNNSNTAEFMSCRVLARMIRRFSILAGVRHIFTFRVAFLLLRMEFMHSSFSQAGSRFFDRGLLLGIVLLAILFYNKF